MTKLRNLKECFVKMEVNIFSEIVYSQFVHLLSGRLEVVEKLEFGETMYAWGKKQEKKSYVDNIRKLFPICTKMYFQNSKRDSFSMAQNVF